MTSVASNVLGAASGQYFGNTINSVASKLEELRTMGYALMDGATDEEIKNEWGRDGVYIGNGVHARNTQLQHARVSQLINELFFRQTNRYLRNPEDMRRLTPEDYRKISIILKDNEEYLVFIKSRYEEQQQRLQKASRLANKAAAATSVTVATATGNVMSGQQALSSGLQQADQFLAPPISAAAVGLIDYRTDKNVKKQVEELKKTYTANLERIDEATPKTLEQIHTLLPDFVAVERKLQSVETLTQIEITNIELYLNFLNKAIETNERRIVQNQAKIAVKEAERDKQIDQLNRSKIPIEKQLKAKNKIVVLAKEMRNIDIEILVIRRRTDTEIRSIEKENEQWNEYINGVLLIELKRIYDLFIKYDLDALNICCGTVFNILSNSEDILVEKNRIKQTRVKEHAKKRGLVSKGLSLMNTLKESADKMFPSEFPPRPPSGKKGGFRKSNKRNLRRTRSRSMKRTNARSMKRTKMRSMKRK